MLGLDSTFLRVDIQAASRVLTHAALEDLLGEDVRSDSTMEDAIGKYMLFFKCHNASSRNLHTGASRKSAYRGLRDKVLHVLIFV